MLGGAWGFKEGFSRPLGNNTSFKLRLNSVLNGCTRRGTFVGNSLGVLGESFLPWHGHPLTSAIFYNLTNSTLDGYRGKHDIFNSMGAGAVAGSIYKSTCTSEHMQCRVTLMNSWCQTRYGRCCSRNWIRCELVILQDDGVNV